MSDHLSSPRALQDPVIDLTDLYFFPVPGRPGRLGVVVDLFPGARPGVAFSDAVLHRIRLAPVEPGADGVLRARRDDGISLDLTFSDIDEQTGDQGGTLLLGGDAIAFRTGDTGQVVSDAVSVFAGLRRDPFFMDVRHEVETRATRRLAFVRPGVDAVAGLNVLSIVVEFEAARVLGAARPALWGAVAETLSRGAPSARFERIGRPEVKNVLLSVNGNDTVNTSADLRDLYNLEDAFAVGQAGAEVFRARLDANLALLDALDGEVAWPCATGQHHPLTETLINDHLVLDTTRPFSERGFLDVERGALTGRPHTTCGGRWLNEDVIDALYSLTVRGWEGPPVSDGVDRASVPATQEFPYLAAPNPDPPVPDPGVPVGAG